MPIVAKALALPALLAGLLAGSGPSQEPVLLDAAVAPAGRVATLGLDAQGAITLGGREEQARALTERLAELLPGARVEDGALTAWRARTPSGLALALALREGEELVYRIALVEDAASREWGLSGPIVRTRGEPFRIVELVNLGTDTIELTLRRGAVGVRPEADPTRRVEELVFADHCFSAGFTTFLPGKTALVDLPRGAAIELGSLR